MSTPRRGHRSNSVCAGRQYRSILGRCGMLLLLISGVFTGCKPRDVVRDTPQMDADSEYWIRIRLYSGITSCLLHSPSPVTLQSQSPLDPSVSVDVSDARIDLKAGQLTVANHTFVGKSLDVVSQRPYLIELEGEPYRGSLRVIVSDDGTSFDVINRLPIEPYLAGVVGAEMPSYWEPEALKAQAIVARTYCLYIKQRFGRQRDWDLSGTQAHQVYKGVRGESAQVWDAVQATQGQVLQTSTQDGRKELFPAYYSAVCGGHTEDSQHVFGGDSYPALKGVVCTYCRKVARPGQYFWPMAVFDKKTVSDRLIARYPVLARLKSIKQIVPLRQSLYDGFTRITMVELEGSNGRTDRLRGEDLRLTIDPAGRKIRSMVCRLADWEDRWAFLSGRGWGHGVGLCQCGAQWLARRGKQADQILQYYYPGSYLKKLY